MDIILPMPLKILHLDFLGSVSGKSVDPLKRVLSKFFINEYVGKDSNRLDKKKLLTAAIE